jgi:uncharacterized protein YjaZ
MPTDIYKMYKAMKKLKEVKNDNLNDLVEGLNNSSQKFNVELADKISNAQGNERLGEYGAGKLKVSKNLKAVKMASILAHEFGHAETAELVLADNKMDLEDFGDELKSTKFENLVLEHYKKQKSVWLQNTDGDWHDATEDLKNKDPYTIPNNKTYRKELRDDLDENGEVKKTYRCTP